MKLLLADDHVLVRDTIAAFLESAGIGQVLPAGSLDAAAEVLRREPGIDLVLLDYDMPGMDGLNGLTAMRRAFPGIPFALISGTAKPSVAREALEAGAAGFVPKTLPARSILGAVQLMASGAVFAPVELLQGETRPQVEGLTEREAGVLRLICDGLTNKEIGRLLDLQEVTVKLHVRNLSRKLNARNRTHAAMIARENAWF